MYSGSILPVSPFFVFINSYLLHLISLKLVAEDKVDQGWFRIIITTNKEQVQYETALIQTSVVKIQYIKEHLSL